MPCGGGAFRGLPFGGDKATPKDYRSMVFFLGAML